MSEIFKPVRIDENRCKGCSLCVYACPNSCIEIGKHVNIKGFNPAVFAHPEKCTSCRNCAVICPDYAISIYKCVTAGSPKDAK